MVATVTSRVGRKPIVIPSGVEVKLQELDIHIKGPKGHMTMPLHPTVSVEFDENKHLKISTKTEGYSRKGSGSKLKNSITGTTRAKISNIVHGVTQGFERKLLLVGVGYRAQAKGTALNLTIGYSHPVVIEAPAGVTFETPSVTEIIVKGIDKHLVGHTAAKVRAVRSPEPYKGKGIRYADENVMRKETKKK
ncbi:MAG: 50S ribosomal protein L6 [Gammaproteobacteria bacterium]